MEIRRIVNCLIDISEFDREAFALAMRSAFPGVHEVLFVASPGSVNVNVTLIFDEAGDGPGIATPPPNGSAANAAGAGAGAAADAKSPKSSDGTTRCSISPSDRPSPPSRSASS